MVIGFRSDEGVLALLAEKKRLICTEHGIMGEEEREVGMEEIMGEGTWKAWYMALETAHMKIGFDGGMAFQQDCLYRFP